MELAERIVIGHIVKSGTGVFAVPAGKTLKIETTPNGEEILLAPVPIGKQWTTVTVSLEITETDA